jgi:hypothetical protein
MARAEQLGAREGIPPATALTRVHLWLLRRIGAWLNRAASLPHEPCSSGRESAPSLSGAQGNQSRLTSAATVQGSNTRKVHPENSQPATVPAPAPALFLCDAGLGGLARWLRAAGYEAVWIPDIEDSELLRKARDRQAMILTTDSLLMERRLLRDGVIPALWLPPTLTMLEQLALVFRELGLSVRNPRCMSCGGELRRVEKEAMRERIPPRTWRWVDEYFLCARCDKLFWHGTHWQRIQDRLRQLDVGPTTAKNCLVFPPRRAQ